MSSRAKNRPRPAGRTVRKASAFRKRKKAKIRGAARPPVFDEDAESGSESGLTQDRKLGGAFSRYLRDVGNAADLLTAAEEIDLGRRMAARAIERIRERLGTCGEGDPFIAEFNPEGLEGGRLEDRLLALLFDKGEGAARMMRFLEGDPEGAAIMRRLVESNLRLVINFAKRFCNGLLPLDELIQEGNLGLLHAAPRYDYRRGFRFSTYATWWIRHAIGRALADKGRTIRLPVHLIETAHKFAKTRAALTDAEGRPPTDDELAAALGLPVEKVWAMSRYVLTPVSLDEKLNDERDETMGDFIASGPEEAPIWRTLLPGGEFKKLLPALDRLLPIEKAVLLRRFGLADEEERTFREIGDQVRLSRERIRQIQEHALDKLRNDRDLKRMLLEIKHDFAA